MILFYVNVNVNNSHADLDVKFEMRQSQDQIPRGNLGGLLKPHILCGGATFKHGLQHYMIYAFPEFISTLSVMVR